ncbi:hypothetical protein [Hornefia porci]|uniref:hypothetical protein n=1 Tax=Hornefia porci TaxID=2652292 RepID=UPI00130155CA|nr:hypothetical protein [Hornefia porci]
MVIQKTEVRPEDIWDDYIDDSKMPSPEEVENFPDTKELDKNYHEGVDQILKEFGL